MADQKVSDLPSLNGADVDAADLLYIVDSSAGSAGSKKITVGQYQLAPVSGGTANGVMYLDGSKVVTTGSGLVFDGTNFSTTGTATATKLIPTGGTATGNGMYLPAANTLAWSTNGAETLRLDSSGNLGLGVTPSAWLGGGWIDFPGNGHVGNSISYSGNTLSSGLNAYYATGFWRYKASSLVASRFDQSNGAFLWFTAPSGTAGNAISFTQAMTLTSGGDLLVGTTTTPSSSNAGFVVAKDGDGTYLRNACTITTTRTHFEFVNGNGTVGTISTNASATAYNTSSDRRLKTNIAPANDAGVVIDAIEVVQHDWKVGGHTRFGVIAQDLNAVAPEAVSVGDDGDEIEKTWGVDYSKLVPMLIKEIQSLRARVAALESA